MKSESLGSAASLSGSLIHKEVKRAISGRPGNGYFRTDQVPPRPLAT